MRDCIRCGKEVHPKDDLGRLEIFLGNAFGIFAQDIHIACSPSRAQFIPKLNVVDDRPEYDKRLMPVAKREELEKKFTFAWQQLQTDHTECL
jgi:hypothetical protein